MAQLLPRFYRAQQAIEEERKLGRILLETGEAPAHLNGKALARSADGHNRDRMRGLPIVGRSTPGGASPGTNPLAAILAKEARGELRL